MVQEFGVASELGLDFENALVHEDDEPCIQIANNPVLAQRCKSIDIPHHHAARYHIKAGTFKVNKVASEEQLADCLAKALPPPKLSNFIITVFGRRSGNA